MKLILILLILGRLAQSGRALPLQGRSHRFKSCSAHKKSFCLLQTQLIHIYNLIVNEFKKICKG